MTDELEQRLRSALTAIADEVPPTHHPWAEHLRRVAATRTRRLWQMAAVAAAVVALVAVPVVVLKIQLDPVELADVPESPQATSPPRTSSGVVDPDPRAEAVYEAQAGETVLTKPVVLMAEGAGADYTRTVAYTVQRNKPDLCIVRVRGYEKPVIKGSTGANCVPMTPPRAGKYVWTSYLVSSGTQAQMLYVLSTPADSILVRTAEGPYGSSHRLAQGADIGLFAVYLPSAKPPAAYTVRDAAKATLENG